MAMRPTYSEKSSVVQSICSGPSGSTSGPGTFSTIRSSRGLMSPEVAVGVVRGEAAAAGGEDIGEVELLFVGAQLDEGVEDLVEHLVGAGVGAVDLVDDDDRPELAGEGLAQHELRLRHRALEGVDQQEAAVGHGEDALDLAAEVGVAGGVDDVDLDARRS